MHAHHELENNNTKDDLLFRIEWKVSFPQLTY